MATRNNLIKTYENMRKNYNYRHTINFQLNSFNNLTNNQLKTMIEELKTLIICKYLKNNPLRYIQNVQIGSINPKKR